MIKIGVYRELTGLGSERRMLVSYDRSITS
jgi:hypothetical protein